MLVTSNLVFNEWDQIFKNQMTTAAAIGRLVHHATILERDWRQGVFADQRAARNVESEIAP